MDARRGRRYPAAPVAIRVPTRLAVAPVLLLILLALLAILVVLVRGQREHRLPAGVRGALPVRGQPSRLELVSSREHDLGIRPCSRTDCAECRLHVARLEPGRKCWAPAAAGPRVIDGTIAAVEQVQRYGKTVQLYYLDPIVRGDPAWTVEASHVVLAGELARFRLGDRVRIKFHGSRPSRKTGHDFYLYGVNLLP